MDEMVTFLMGAELCNNRIILEQLKEACRRWGFKPEVWSEIELAVQEGLNNAVEHGCHEQAELQIRVNGNWDGSLFVCDITDPGVFCPENLSVDLPEDPLEEGGRGFFLMSQLMDQVEHFQGESGHTLRLKKRIGLEPKPIVPVVEVQPIPSSDVALQIADLEATIESMAEDLSRSYEEVSALFRFAEELATSSGLHDFLNRSMDRLLGLVSAEKAYVRFFSSDQTSLNLSRLPADLPSGYPGRLPLEQDTIETRVVGMGHPVTVEDCGHLDKEDPLWSPGRGAFVCPIFFQSKVLGCLVIVQKVNQPYFSAGELNLIRFVADFMGIVTTTHSLQEQRQAEQRMLRELEIASTIQQGLLPKQLPANPFYRTSGHCQSARQVGGDFFDALSIGENNILLVIADVMGKGVPAAMFATILRTAIHSRLDLADRPAELLTAVNTQIAPDLGQMDMFITAQIGYISAKDHVLRLAHAGHCPMLHCDANARKIHSVSGDGLPLGILKAFEYEEVQVPLAMGDRCLFLTDGVYEIDHIELGMMGLDRFVEEAEVQWNQLNEDPLSDLLRFAQQYSEGKPASDDRTLLCLERIF